MLYSMTATLINDKGPVLYYVESFEGIMERAFRSVTGAVFAFIDWVVITCCSLADNTVHLEGVNLLTVKRIPIRL